MPVKANNKGIIQDGNSGIVGEGLGVVGEIVELEYGEDVGDGVVEGTDADVGEGVGDVPASARAAYAAPVGLIVKLVLS